MNPNYSSGNTADSDKITLADISFKFGIVMTLSGLLGVPLGSYVSQMIRHQVPNADPIVCATTLLASVPLLFFGFVSANYSLPLCYGLTFFAGEDISYNSDNFTNNNILHPGLLLNANWSIVSDMTLYIVVPPRRGIASATQILVSHMFGDAFSPYLIGAMADSLKPIISPNTTVVTQNPYMHSEGRKLTPEEYDLEFRALEYSLFSCCFFQVKRNQTKYSTPYILYQQYFSGVGSFFLLRGVLVCHQ